MEMPSKRHAKAETGTTRARDDTFATPETHTMKMSLFVSALVCALLLSMPAVAQTTFPISFTVNDIGQTPGANVKARFTLMNCGNNQPMVVGTPIIGTTKDFVSSSLGVITRTLYGNNAIQCAGQATTNSMATMRGCPSPITPFWFKLGSASGFCENGKDGLRPTWLFAWT
jgi:hypothetical protein